LIVAPAVRGALGGAPGRFAIDIPPLELPSGALVYILGPNGSGKTVYLRSLVDDFPSLRCTGARILREGTVVHPVLIRQSADDNLAPGLTVLEHMVVWDVARSVREAIIPRMRSGRLHALLDDFSALNLAPNKLARELSGGQKQGLVLLTRLLRAPDLLLLDEFTSAVDAQSTERLLDVVRSAAHAHGTTSLIVTHDLDEASKNADVCVVLSCGRVFGRIEIRDRPLEGRFEDVKALVFNAWRAQVSR